MGAWSFVDRRHREGAQPPGHEGPPPGLRGTRGRRQPGDRPGQDPHGPAGAPGSHRARYRLDRPRLLLSGLETDRRGD